MEKEKKEIRISLSKLLLIIGVLLIVIICMAIEIWHLNKEKCKDITTANIDEISNTNEISNEESKENNAKEWKIEGHYSEYIETDGDPDSYNFQGNEVAWYSIAYTYYGNFEIKDDTIYITYNRSYDTVEQKEDNSALAEINTEEKMTIIDENTLLYGRKKLIKNSDSNNPISTEEKEKDIYIELNEENYMQYQPSRVIDISDNKDGTYTITSRVYEETVLPILSNREVKELENGNSVNIFGYSFKIDNSQNKPDGHDYLIVSSDGRWKFYLSKNNDETANFKYYTEELLVKPTEIYMSATVDGSVFGSKAPEYHLSEKEQTDDYVFLVYSEEIEFENGKISSFKWTGV